MLVQENFLLGILGGGLGVTLGLLLAGLISWIGIPMPPPPNMNSGYVATIRPDATMVVLGFTVGMVATLLASLWAARGVVRIPVVDALRQNG